MQLYCGLLVVRARHTSITTTAQYDRRDEAIKKKVVGFYYLQLYPSRDVPAETCHESEQTMLLRIDPQVNLVVTNRLHIPGLHGLTPTSD